MRLTYLVFWIMFSAILTAGQRVTLFFHAIFTLFSSLPCLERIGASMPAYDFRRPRTATPKSLLRNPYVLTILALLVALSAIWAVQKPGPQTDPERPEDLLPYAHVRPDSGAATEDTRLLQPEPHLTEISGRIRRGEAFSDALRREGVSHAHIFELVSAVRKGVHRAEFNPNIVQVGDRYTLEVDTLGAIHRFEYVKRHALETRFVAGRQNGRLTARKEQVPLNREVVVVSGEIEDMLWKALSATGENPAILSVKMVDIFESMIDFMVDPRRGDRFSLAVEKFLKNGQFVRYGDILAAEYQAAHEQFQAFFYEDPDGASGYYDAKGKSLRGLFLKSPLNFRRISSTYSSRRFHPVLKKYTPHHGIDYAANIGAPVWATADGVVTFIGRKGALGKYMEVRHKNGYKTGYGHLSRFRNGLRKGAHVKQKQVIGYVGVTGRTTGPHLHYNFIALDKRGRYHCIDPARVANRPTGKPVLKRYAAHFSRHRDRLLALLNEETGSVVTALLEVGAGGEASGVTVSAAATLPAE